jgi:hypothetical protein
MRDPNLLMCLESYLIERQNQKKVVPGRYPVAAQLQTIADKLYIFHNFTSKTVLKESESIILTEILGCLVTLDEPLFRV